MADRYIKLGEAGRHVVRGVQDMGDHFLASQDRDAQLTYTLDYTRLLGSETIDSIATETSGATLNSSSNTTTSVTLNVSATGYGYVEVQATDSAGLIHVHRLYVREKTHSRTGWTNTDYGMTA